MMGLLAILKDAQTFEDFCDKAEPWAEKIDNALEKDLPQIKQDYMNTEETVKKEVEGIKTNFGALKYDFKNVVDDMKNNNRKESATPVKNGDEKDPLENLKNMYNPQPTGTVNTNGD